MSRAARREYDRCMDLLADLGENSALELTALVLKKALEDRIAAFSRSASWPEIIADLDSLTETEIEQDGKRFTVRSAPRPAASLAIRAAGVALPPTVREASA